LLRQREACREAAPKARQELSSNQQVSSETERRTSNPRCKLEIVPSASYSVAQRAEEPEDQADHEHDYSNRPPNGDPRPPKVTSSPELRGEKWPGQTHGGVPFPARLRHPEASCAFGPVWWRLDRYVRPRRTRMLRLAAHPGLLGNRARRRQSTATALPPKCVDLAILNVPFQIGVGLNGESRPRLRILRGYAWPRSSSASDRLHRRSRSRRPGGAPGMAVAEQYSAAPITS